jgi:hypothetical protein
MRLKGGNLTPLSPLQPFSFFRARVFIGWRGEFRREGALPPLKFSPSLKHQIIRTLRFKLFERGIKGVSDLIYWVFKRGETPGVSLKFGCYKNETKCLSAGIDKSDVICYY